MARRVSLVLATCLVSLLPVPPSDAIVGDVIDNEEQRVNGHGRRGGAEQFFPDISDSFIVWQDTRGDSTNGRGNAIWSKNLSNRGESPVTTLSTQQSPPRISGMWVVWADRKPGSTNDDVFARKLPSGKVIRVTKHPATQLNPAIDGKTVVWEDKRNGDIDIFKKVVGSKKKEQPVVVAPGDQTLPAISGKTVAWRDGRRGLTTADVYVRVGKADEIEIARATGAARSISPHQVAVFGDRVLWNEVDPAKCGNDCVPKILKTCTLPCPDEDTVDELSPLAGDGIAIHDIDLSGTQATWLKGLPGGGAEVLTADLATCPPCGTPTVIDTSDPVDPRLLNARVHGTRFAWAKADDGLDVFWQDFGTPPIGPIRANSISLGPFVDHFSPAADGDFVAYGAGGGNWATELSPRRHFAVSSELGTGYSAPRITGTRAVWSDTRKCQLASTCNESSADTYERDPLDTGAEAQLSGPDFTVGGQPDADGSNIAWACRSPTAADERTDICVHDGTTLVAFDVSGFLLDPSSSIGSFVRISGDLVAWYEFFEGAGNAARLHVLNTSNGDDEIVGDGVDVVGDVPYFDISGSEVVWAGLRSPEDSKIWNNTATGDCGVDPLPCSSTDTAVVFEPPVNQHILDQVSIDGTRVAWVDCPHLFSGNCDVYTRTLAETDSHLVSNGSASGVRQPNVDGDRIYWVYDQPGGSGASDPLSISTHGDIFMESVTGTPLPPGDTIAPGPPTGFAAGPNTGVVELSWTNPGDSDFFRVRILRRLGTEPPKSIDDRKATVVYDDDGTSFTDEDVAPGKTYTYRAFAYDLDSNFAAPATDKSG